MNPAEPRILTTQPADLGTRTSVLFVTFLASLPAALLALLGCSPKPPPPPAELRLFFTAQTHGRLTPCGCFSGQFGGISRLKSSLLASGVTNHFGVDTGDALEGVEDFHRLRHRHLASVFAGLGYVAMNAGRMEASLTAAALRQLATQSPVPLLSANIRDRATGQPLLAPSITIQRDGLRIGIVGVVDPRGFDDGPGEGLEIERMQTCLARVLPEVRRSADLILVLAHTDEASLAALAGEFYEVALFLGGRVSQPASGVMKENRSLIYYTGNEGKSYGALRLSVAHDGAVELLENNMVLLTDRIPEHPDVLAVAADYRRQVRGTQLAVDDPGRASENSVPTPHASNGYAGSETCLSCHPQAARVWQSSAHAHAFRSLVERDSDADPACIGCHTVGFGASSGYRREYGTRRLVDVGCESCHGPGAAHVADRQPGATPAFKFRPLGAGDCRKCHHGEFSRPFDWDRFWPTVKH